MNYRHLQFFVTVVQQGSLKAAADALDVSQPAISAAIRNLEHEFGARLLDRRRDGSVPTIYGKSLYDSAVMVGRVVDNARARISALKDPTRRHLRIGTGPSVSTVHVSAAVCDLVDAFPDMRVDHVTGESYAVFEQQLMAQDIDVALCHVPSDRRPTSLACRLISNNPIGALVAAAHLPPHKKSMTRAEMLRDFRWITSRDDEIRKPRGLPAAPAGVENPMPMAVIAEDLHLIKALTLKTRSVGFLPLHMVESELRDGDLIQLVAPGVRSSRPIYALTRKDEEAAPVIERFLNNIERAFKGGASRKKQHRTVELVD